MTMERNDHATALLISTSTEIAPAQELGDAAKRFASRSKTANTLRAYTSDWADFTRWCAEHDHTPLPASPRTVGDYLADRAEGDPTRDRASLSVATLNRRLVAISQMHKLAKLASPAQDEDVRSVMKGIRRTLGTAQRQVAPAVSVVLRQWVSHLPTSMLGQRDKALLLLGFAGAFRRSEITALDVADVRFVAEGMIVTLKRSKTDQEGAGERKGIPLGTHADTCPVRALQTYLKASGITAGPLFRPINRHGQIKPKRLNGSDIAVIIKRTAAAAGFDPDLFSGHSLRAGFATAAATAGASDRAIKQQTGHKSDRVLQRYIREGSLFRDNAASSVGL